MNNHAVTTVFMSTRRGDFARVDLDLLMTVRLSDAASAVMRYGFKSICVEDFGASSFPMLKGVERTVHVDGSGFWIEAVSAQTGERDRTSRVLIRDIRQAAFLRTPVVLCLDGREREFGEFYRGMGQKERETAFGAGISEELVFAAAVSDSEFQPMSLEKSYG